MQTGQAVHSACLLDPDKPLQVYPHSPLPLPPPILPCSSSCQVYFKTNRSFIREFPNLRGYVQDLYQTPGAGRGGGPRWRICMRLSRGSAGQGRAAHKVGAPGPEAIRSPWHMARVQGGVQQQLQPQWFDGSCRPLPNRAAGVAASVNIDHIKTHYFTSHPKLNYYAIVPKGGGAWWEQPHDRAQRFA